jgi:hypothetical protein
MKTQYKLKMIANLAILVACSVSVFAANGASGAAHPAPSGSGASVVGKVKLAGQAPQPSKLSMNADPSCAKLHSGPAMSQDFVAGSDNTLGNVIVFISDGLAGRTFDVPAEAVTFEQKGCEYAPRGRTASEPETEDGK